MGDAAPSSAGVTQSASVDCLLTGNQQVARLPIHCCANVRIADDSGVIGKFQVSIGVQVPPCDLFSIALDGTL